MSAATTQLALDREAPLHLDARGVIRVGKTRVTFESVIGLFEQGATAEEIAMHFDALDLHAIYATRGYYLGHRPPVQIYLDRQPQGSLAARREAESRSPSAQIRKRLNRQRTLGRLRRLADENLDGNMLRGVLQCALSVDSLTTMFARVRTS